MTLDADSFVQLCERLRALGMVKVEGFGFSAVFDVPSLRASQAKPLATEPVPIKRPVPDRKNVTDVALKEELYARELGKV